MIRKKDLIEACNRITDLETEIFKMKYPHKYELFEKVFFRKTEKPNPIGRGFIPCNELASGVIIAQDVSSVFDPFAKRNNYYNRYIICEDRTNYIFVRESNIVWRYK